MQPNAEGAIEAGIMIMSHGYVGGDEHVDTVRPVLEGKNLGKSNETTPLEQAIFEANSRAKKKVDQNYRLKEDELDSVPVGPMLAHPFEKRKHNVEYPCYVQPKLNGVRCLAHRVDETTVELRSRMGKLYGGLLHIEQALLPLLEIGEIWDGELYNHHLSFQEITSAVKKSGDNTDKIQYWVYDMVSEISPFDMRIDHVRTRLEEADIDDLIRTKDVLVGVPTIEEDSETAVLEAAGMYVEDGFEGVIVRNVHGMYAVGQRSADLLKLKKMQDAEYPIVAQAPDTTGEVVFRCMTPKGAMFKVKPKGTHAERVAMVDVDHRDKLLTVQFQELSEDGIPLFPVGLGVRDYE